MPQTIDNPWLADSANGGPDGPWLLNTVNETYELGVDVTANGSGFVATQAGTTLDIKGHDVVYGNASPPTLPNGDFTSDSVGSTSLLPGIDSWTAVGGVFTVVDMTTSGTSPLRYPSGYYLDLAGAPLTQCLRASVVAAVTCTLGIGSPASFHKAGHGLNVDDPIFLAGFTSTPTVNGLWLVNTVADTDNFTVKSVNGTVLNVTAVTDGTGQFGKALALKSSSITITTANVQYAASVLTADAQPQGGGSHDVAVLIYDTVSGTYLTDIGSQDQIPVNELVRSNTRGESATAVVLPTTTNSLQVHIFLANFATSAAQNVDVARVRFTRAYDCGVVFSGGYELQYPPYNNWSATVKDAYVAGKLRLGFTLKDSSFTPATLTPVLTNGVLTSVTVTLGGSNYTGTPDLCVVGGVDGTRRCNPAVIHAVMSGNAISSVVVDDGGGYYTSTPTITVAGGGGKIRQGAGQGFRGHAIDCYNKNGDVTLKDVVGRVLGDDGFCFRHRSLNTSSTGTLTIGGSAGHGVVAEYTNRSNVLRRFNTHAAIYCSGEASTSHIDYNIIKDCPQQPAVTTPFSNTLQALTCTMSNNGIYPRCCVENGYALPPLISGSQFLNNTVDGRASGRGGRGMYVAAGTNQTVQNIVATGNNIHLYERGNRESGLASPIRSLRVRNQENGASTSNALLQNNTVTGNVFMAYTEAGAQTVAMGARISLIRNAASTTDAPGNVFSDNYFGSVTSDGTLTAVGLEIDAHYTDITVPAVMERNVCESNHISLRILGTDTGNSGGAVVGNLDLVDFTLSKSSSGAVMTHQALAMGPGQSGNRVTDLRLISPAFSGGATPITTSGTITWLGTGTKDVDLGWYETTTCVDGVAAPISGATVTLTNTNSVEDDSGTTNGSGVVVLTAITKRFAQTTSDPASITTTTYSPHTISGSKVGYITDTDTATLTADGTVTLVLVAGTANTPPTLSNVPAAATIPELVLYTFTATATDPDPGDTLTFSLVGAPSGAAIGSSSGVFTWTPTEAQGPGAYSFTVQVSDGTDTDTAGTVLTVTEVNVAPTLSGVPSSATIPVSVLYTFTATSTDSDIPAQTKTFSLVSAPTGAAIGSSSGVFTWTPATGQAGTYPFTVRVSDGVTNTDAAITLTVQGGVRHKKLGFHRS